MEKELLKQAKVAIEYIVPATAIVLTQIYYRKWWIWTLQTFSLFFGSIFAWMLFVDVTEVIFKIFTPEIMETYWDTLWQFITWIWVIWWFYILLFFFAKEEIFKIFDKLKKWQQK